MKKNIHIKKVMSDDVQTDLLVSATQSVPLLVPLSDPNLVFQSKINTTIISIVTYITILHNFITEFYLRFITNFGYNNY